MKKSLLYKYLALTVTSALTLASFDCASSAPDMASNSGTVSNPKIASLPRRAQGARQGVYYSLFVRSFADSDGDGIGDFNGITAKLDYLNDGDDSTTSDLGITGIWLLPIYPSQSYHGYDVDDYYSVNPDYGTMEDFENLVKECKKRGISIILDMTCNHSSTYTDYFKKSRDPANEHHEWYRWITEDDNRYNINQQMWGHRVWNEDNTYRGNYYAGLFGPHMPDFNLDSPALRQEFKKIMKFWLDKGVAGFRYDAAGHIYNSAKTPAGTESVTKAVEWWKELIAYNKSINPGTFNVGEVWENNSIRAQYIAGLGSDFHFDMGGRIMDTVKAGEDGNNSYANGLGAEYERLAQSNPDYLDAPFLSNHDEPRSAGLLRGDAELCKAAASLYLLTEGVPFIYYGEEIGMRSGTDDPSKRTPMLWAENKSSGKPKDKLQTSWSESRYNTKTIPVSEQQKDASSLLNYYKQLIRVRTAHPAFFAGRFTPKATGSDKISSWQMKSSEETAFVMVNVSGEEVLVKVPEEYKAYKVAFGSDFCESLSAEVKIPARRCLVLSNGDF